jgi:hypothetical protein
VGEIAVGEISALSARVANQAAGHPAGARGLVGLFLRQQRVVAGFAGVAMTREAFAQHLNEPHGQLGAFVPRQAHGFLANSEDLGIVFGVRVYLAQIAVGAVESGVYEPARGVQRHGLEGRGDTRGIVGLSADFGTGAHVPDALRCHVLGAFRRSIRQIAPAFRRARNRRYRAPLTAFFATAQCSAWRRRRGAARAG